MECMNNIHSFMLKFHAISLHQYVAHLGLSNNHEYSQFLALICIATVCGSQNMVFTYIFIFKIENSIWKQ